MSEQRRGSPPGDPGSALVYFDPSAFVKLVVEGGGSDLATELWDGCDAALAARWRLARQPASAASISRAAAATSVP